MRKYGAKAALAAGLLLCAAAGSASAGVRVDLLVYENADNAGIGHLDLWVDVINGGSTVDFVFHNDSTGPGVVANIYVEMNSLISSGSLGATSGTVDFNLGGSPGNPAQPAFLYGGAWGGNEFSARADSPAPSNGIGMGESLTVTFDLVGSYADVVAALQPGAADGFRIAQHVISVGQASVWTINTPTPGSLGLLGLAGLVAVRRRR
jgi:uncharacterized protein (TIGR03382 family)